jgi:O-acetyl-ADP-ribose deacetylase
MKVCVVDGDLLDQDVEVIVNAWNRNFIPWWLLLPQGVSGAIKRRAGLEPFRELRRHGLLGLGEAVLTSAGKLPFRGIIHVAGIDFWWRASMRSVELSVQNALELAKQSVFASVAFPLIGAGTGGLRLADVERSMRRAMAASTFEGEIRIVRYQGR